MASAFLFQTGNICLNLARKPPPEPPAFLSVFLVVRRAPLAAAGRSEQGMWLQIGEGFPIWKAAPRQR